MMSSALTKVIIILGEIRKPFPSILITIFQAASSVFASRCWDREDGAGPGAMGSIWASPVALERLNRERPQEEGAKDHGQSCFQLRPHPFCSVPSAFWPILHREPFPITDITSPGDNGSYRAPCSQKSPKPGFPCSNQCLW